MFKSVLIGVILALGVSTAKANELEISLPVAAYHIGGQTNPYGKPYNDTQFKSLGGALNYRFDLSRDLYVGAGIGSFENSYFKRSNFAVGDFGYKVNKHLNAGVEVGAVTGYGVTGRARPAVVPYVEVKEGHVSVNFSYIQSTMKGGHSAIGISVGYHF